MIHDLPVLDLAPFEANHLLEQDRQRRLAAYAAADIVKRAKAGRKGRGR